MRVNARKLMLFLLALAACPRPANAAGAVLTEIDGVTSSVFQRDQSSFSGLGIRLRIHPPQLADGLTIVPMLEYWRNKSTIKKFGIESTRKDATLGGFLGYDFRREGWHPYVGAGVAMHFLSSEVDAPTLGLDNASDSIIKGGLLLVGGVNFGLAGNLGNLLELEYHHLPDQSQLKFNWGLSWAF